MRDVFEALNKDPDRLKLRKLKNKVFPAAEALARDESDEANRKLAALKAAKADEKSIAEAATTAAEFLELGGTRADLKYDIARGWVTVLDPR